MRNNSGEGVQHALLKIMEGGIVKLAKGEYIETTNMLFVCGGAFVGLEKISSRSHTFGYIYTSKEDDLSILNRLNARVKPNDLIEFGLIPEFTGRLPITARFQELSQKMLVRIMTEPANSIYSQYAAIFKSEGVELSVEPAVFEQIADLAVQYRTGARSLRGLFEELITPVLYVVPDDPRIEKVVISSLFTEPRVVRRAS